MKNDSSAGFLDRAVTDKTEKLLDKMPGLVERFEDILGKAKTLLDRAEAEEATANGEFLSQERGEAKNKASALLHAALTLIREGKEAALELNRLKIALNSLEAASSKKPDRQ